MDSNEFVYIKKEALDELLFASFDKCTDTFRKGCPTLYKKLREAQKEAGQVLGWDKLKSD